MIILDGGEVVTAAQHAAQILQRTGSSRSIEATKVISLRMPLSLLAEIQGFAHKSGKSRNSTIAMLLEVGLEEVKNHLSPEDLQDLKEITAEHHQDVLAEEQPC